MPLLFTARRRWMSAGRTVPEWSSPGPLLRPVRMAVPCSQGVGQAGVRMLQISGSAQSAGLMAAARR